MLIVCEHFCISRENPRQITQSCSAVAQCSLPGPNCATRPSAWASSPRKETPSHSYTSRWLKIHSNTSRELSLLLLLLLFLLLSLLLFFQWVLWPATWLELEVSKLSQAPVGQVGATGRELQSINIHRWKFCCDLPAALLFNTYITVRSPQGACHSPLW